MRRTIRRPRRPGRRRGQPVWLCALVLVAAVLAGLSACSSSDPAPTTPAPAASVALDADVPQGLSIGVVVSDSSAPADGAQWRQAAEGAKVAVSRFALGKTTVTLIPVNDKGTAAGAVAAVTTLAGRGVAGIVLATSGPHLSGALQNAATRGIPVLLPYATSADGLPAHAWLTGPDAASVDQRLVASMKQQQLSRPYLIDAGGGALAGLSPAGSTTYAAGQDADALARRLAAAQRKNANSFDAVVISGPAELQGRLVASLQGVDLASPVLFSSDALSPIFPQTLAKAGGSLSGSFQTAGIDGGDAEALQPTEAGRAAAAYFSALSLLADDPQATDLFGQQPFARVAGTADLRSHDAVVALVRAAATAKSTDPKAVATALAGLRLERQDGLAGPALDFATPTTVPADSVQALAATAVSPGVRPASPTASLYWYPTASS